MATSERHPPAMYRQQDSTTAIDHSAASQQQPRTSDQILPISAPTHGTARMADQLQIRRFCVRSLFLCEDVAGGMGGTRAVG
jgi:hypothetical protein